MRIKMELLSDAIFGNGMSIPGGEDISVLCDEYGFPYYKGTTLKGVFREELDRYSKWVGNINCNELMGTEGDEFSDNRIIFGDMVISNSVKDEVLKELGTERPNIVLDLLTNIRTFTRINEDGVADEGSLRMARCVNKGLIFYGEIICSPDQEDIIKNVLGMIKWIGSMRNRGFGNVKITAV